MVLDKLSKLEKDPPLSGAYVVKQVTTSRTKDSMNPNDQDCCVRDVDVSHGQNLTKHGKVEVATQASQFTQPRQHKKQVGRRLHTSKPYQERLLNMAEARREIVTALKYHRAAMKQASEQEQQQKKQQEEQQEQQRVQSSQSPSFEQDGRFKSRRNPRIYPSCTPNFPNYMDGFSHSYLSYPPPTVPNSYTYPAASPLAPQPLMADNPNFMLPNQTLGLSLNFHDFNNSDATLHPSYSFPFSSPPPLSVVIEQEALSVGISQEEGSSSLVDSIQSCASTLVTTGGLHRAMDDEGMAEIKSLGEKHQMEWNDTMNLVKSACWFKFLKNMEHWGAPEAKTEDDPYQIFDELVEFPAWLNANGSCLEQCSEDSFQDSTLPCMDIGDIEGMDADWLT